MPTFSVRSSLAVAVGATVAATGLTAAFATSAGAQQVAAQGKPSGGDNGDVKIHSSATAVSDERNEPHVCVFYLDAFNFDPGQSVSWRIESWPPTGDRGVVDSGTITLGSSGDGNTANQTLRDGHYKLSWTFAGEKGSAKHKVFWVSCGAAPAPKPAHETLPVTG